MIKLLWLENKQIKLQWLENNQISCLFLNLNSLFYFSSFFNHSLVYLATSAWFSMQHNWTEAELKSTLNHYFPGFHCKLSLKQSVLYKALYTVNKDDLTWLKQLVLEHKDIDAQLCVSISWMKLTYSLSIWIWQSQTTAHTQRKIKFSCLVIIQKANQEQNSPFIAGFL